MINLELYRAFYAVAKTGSLTAAAKELYVSQPALSQSIINLENQLGGQLFVRTQKGMILTPEGENMLKDVKKALDLFMTAENDFLQMKHLAAGSIRIGASDTLCRHFLLEYISRFHKIYPDVNIEVTNRTTSDTISLLRSGKVDVAFVNLPVKLQENEYTVHECMPLNDCFVGDISYKHLSLLNAKDIVNLPLIMMENRSNTRRLIDSYIESLGYKPHPQIELGSFDLVVEFAKAGLGVGCVTREFIKKELECQELFEVKTSFELPKRAIGGITRKDASLTFAALRFIEIVYSD